MLVLMMRLTCATETDSVAGSICLSTRRTPGWCHAARTSSDTRGSMPMRRSDGIWIANWRMPPTITA